LYFRLSASDLKDERWQGANFGRQRVKDVAAALKWLEKYDTTKYNIQSISTAKLGTVVIGAIAGKKAKATPDDFLPFDTRKLKKENGLTDESMEVLRRLMKTRKMNGRVIALLAEELKSASMRGNDSD
jgi:hypothetical protein